MHPLTRIVPLALFVIHGLSIAPAWATVPEPQPRPAVTSLDDGRPVPASARPGQCVALHFITACSSPPASTFVREVLRKAPTIAGVRHMFISAEPIDAVKAWAAQFGPDSGAVFADSGGALARDLGLELADPAVATPATVVLDAEGSEVLRVIGAAPDAYADFDRFARLLTDKTRLPAIAGYNLPKGKTLAVEGYDIVAYFTKNRAIEGKPDLASVYRGVTYRFATEESRRLFAAEPTKYLPTYGGWCASAMGAKGAKVGIDPKNFKVSGGRLFLFYRSLLSDALKDWNKHDKEWEPAADANWKRLTGEDAVRPGP